MDATVRSISEATPLPLSIIIVGVGHADFSNMNILDADDNPLKVGAGIFLLSYYFVISEFKNLIN